MQPVMFSVIVTIQLFDIKDIVIHHKYSLLYRHIGKCVSGTMGLLFT